MRVGSFIVEKTLNLFVDVLSATFVAVKDKTLYLHSERMGASKGRFPVSFCQRAASATNVFRTSGISFIVAHGKLLVRDLRTQFRVFDVLLEIAVRVRGAFPKMIRGCPWSYPATRCVAGATHHVKSMPAVRCLDSCFCSTLCWEHVHACRHL